MASSYAHDTTSPTSPSRTAVSAQGNTDTVATYPLGVIALQEATVPAGPLVPSANSALFFFLSQNAQATVCCMSIEDKITSMQKDTKALYERERIKNQARKTLQHEGRPEQVNVRSSKDKYSPKAAGKKPRGNSGPPRYPRNPPASISALCCTRWPAAFGLVQPSGPCGSRCSKAFATTCNRTRCRDRQHDDVDSSTPLSADLVGDILEVNELMEKTSTHEDTARWIQDFQDILG